MSDFIAKLQREVVYNPKSLVLLSVPSVLYTLQNNLLYIALANLDAAAYQVCYQLKILTTALFSVYLLKRKISTVRWLSLVLLLAGVSLANLESAGGKGGGSEKTTVEQRPVLGFIAVLMASLTSGFAGVWFEKILKESKTTTMWMRNIQMGVTSIFIAFLGVFLKDRELVAEKGFFHGYTAAVVGVILLQALGGLVVAAVVKYADNILKGFGSSISIIISCLFEMLFFDFRPGWRFFFGCCFVNYAIYVYSAGRLFCGPMRRKGVLPSHR